MSKVVTALPENTFGVEFEVANYLDFQAVAEALSTHLTKELGPTGHFPVRSFGSSSAGSQWVVKDDGSCGGEITSPALSWNNVQELISASTFLKSKYRTSRSCGLHVHHHLPDLTAAEIRRLWLTWAVFEPVISTLVQSSRLSNSYCAPLLGGGDYDDDYYDDYDDRPTRRRVNEAPQEINSAVSAMTPAGSKVRRFISNRGRYVSLNFCKWWTGGTVEVRLHHGTLLPEEVVSWVLFTQIFLHMARKNTKLSKLKKWSKLSMTSKYNVLVQILKHRVDIPQLPEILSEMQSRMKKYHKGVAKRLLNQRTKKVKENA